MRDAVARWERDGFVILPGFVPRAELEAARAELGVMFPTADEFHDDTGGERYARFRDDEFAGIDDFPFAAVEVSLLCVHPRIVELAEAILGTRDVRIYAGEAWAKYTGAADYDQELHRDYLNHTLMAPTDDPRFRQLEMFLYLSDVTDELGPPHYVSREHAADVPAMPNWHARADLPELYDAEVSAAGPAGTVVAYGIGTMHRGTAMTAPRGARFTIHVNYRAATTDWAQRHGWANAGGGRAWSRFVERAAPRQLELFGFPPPGHPYWTGATLHATALRYPKLDLAPWSTGAE